jgi:hypothetical protein
MRQQGIKCIASYRQLRHLILSVGVNLKIEMFNLFKKSKKSKTELEFFKQFFKSDYKYFGKIHFPVLIYPELPAKPIFKNWREQQQYIIDKIIPLSFKEDFNTAYSKYDGQRFEMIEKNQNGDINHSKRNAMVQHYLDSQQKVFMSKRELERTEFKIGDFNVFIQYLDDTPQQILETTLKAISAELPNSELILQRFPDERNEFKLNKLLLTLEDIAPFHHLDRMYDTERIWELLQPEESSFLMIGTNSNNVINLLNEKGLEIEEIEN